MVNKVREILKLIKVRFTVPVIAYIWSTLIGSLVASRGVLNPLHLVYAFLVPFFILTAIYVHNDAMDYEIDRINRVDRPIATGSVTRMEGIILGLILFSCGILISAFINIETLLLSVTLSILGLIYSTPPIRLRDRLFAKHIITPTGFLISSLFGGTIVGNPSLQVIFLGVVMFMTVLSGTPIFDLPDLRGDRAGRVKSIGVLYGPRSSLKVSIIGFILVIAITTLSYPYVGFNVLTPLMISSICLVFIWFSYSLLRKWQNIDYCRKILKRIIGLNFLYQLSFILGLIPLL